LLCAFRSVAWVSLAGSALADLRGIYRFLQHLAEA
jgi:hypothetical protein